MTTPSEDDALDYRFDLFVLARLAPDVPPERRRKRYQIVHLFSGKQMIRDVLADGGLDDRDRGRATAQALGDRAGMLACDRETSSAPSTPSPPPAQLGRRCTPTGCSPRCWPMPSGGASR
jgi:hypothetical protein